jgi:flavorubredoxin
MFLRDIQPEPWPANREETSMSAAKVLIVFDSRSGVTEAQANALAEGARASGADVRLRRAREDRLKPMRRRT